MEDLDEIRSRISELADDMLGLHPCDISSISLLDALEERFGKKCKDICRMLSALQMIEREASRNTKHHEESRKECARIARDIISEVLSR